jgi:uncharacterized protein YecE (DUF72 family)
VTLPLFDPPQNFDRAGLSARLRALAEQEIWIGTSSWNYEGWLDQIYTPDRYMVRGRFSQKRFAAECLAEYAETFPVVCGDFSFYQFPTPAFWQRLFGSAPPSLRFALKVPEEVTAEVFPKHPRYGPRAGMKNDAYLNADALEALFLEPLDPYRDRIATLIFEFGARSASPREFVSALAPFLSALPGTFRYAVEIRNRTYLGAPYFDCLRQHSSLAARRPGIRACGRKILALSPRDGGKSGSARCFTRPDPPHARRAPRRLRVREQSIRRECAGDHSSSDRRVT